MKTFSPTRLPFAAAVWFAVATTTTTTIPATAATLVVNTLEDEWNEDGDCSLREALIAANYDARVDGCPAGSGADDIVFADNLAGGTINITLSGGLKAINSITIRGQGITLDGGGTNDLLMALADPGHPSIQTYTLEGLTLRRSRGMSLRVVAHSVTLRDCVIEDNGYLPGGGLVGLSSSHDEFLAERVSFRGNRGGNVLSATGPVVPGLTPVVTSLRHCRFEDNPGGALLQHSGAINVVDILQTDIRRNGSGVWVQNTTPHGGQSVTIRDTTIADNGPTDARALHVVNASLLMERTRILTNRGSLQSAAVSVSGNRTNHNAVIRHCEIRGNLTGENGFTAGGLLLTGMPGLIEDTTIADNRTSAPLAGNGAGGIRYDGPRLEIRRTTISGNAMTRGQRTGGIRFTGELVLENSTVSANSPAGIDAFGVVRSRFVNNTILLNEGSGLAFTGGTGEDLVLANNLLAGNAGFDLSGSPIARTGGWNLIGRTSIPALPTDLLDVDPDVLPLADNGGPTATHALGPRSAALDAGDNSLAADLATDQRGLPRVAGARVDIGAVESSGTPPPTPTPPWIGDLVWEDLNGNGQRDPGEPGLHAVTVRLWQDVNANETLDPADGPPFRLRQTAGDGRYEFAELPPGRYLVDVEMDPLVLRNDPQLTTAVPVYAIHLGPGQGYANADFGFRARGGSIEGRAWEDCHANGIRDAGEAPLAGLPIDLYRDVNDNGQLDANDLRHERQLADDLGVFRFARLATDPYLVVADTPALPASFVLSTPANPVLLKIEGGAVKDTGVSATRATTGFGFFAGAISGLVLFDTDGDGSPNPFLDQPLVGVEMRLYRDANGNGSCDPADPLVNVDLVDFAGGFRFELLPPDDAYVVVVNQATLPIWANTLVAGSLPIARNSQHFRQDCRQYPSPLLYRDSTVSAGSIGDRVWRDLDADGIQDPGEPGLAHFRVRLLDATTNVLATVWTDAEGRYSFNGLGPGTYRVAFGPSRATLAITLRDRGPDDGADSDPDPVNGMTEPVPLAAGEHLTSIDAGLIGAQTEPGLIPPRITRVRRLPGNGIEIEFLAASGTLYRAERTETLDAARWRSLGPPRMGDGSLVSFVTSLSATESHGFLRVVALRE